MVTSLTFSFAVLAAIIIPRIVGGPLLRTVAFVGLGAMAVYSGLAPLWSGILIALAPIIVRVLSMLYFYWLGRRALAGKMGKQQKWMAELVRDGNTAFIEAMEHLDRTDMKEIVVIAESKEELKELALERANETEN